MDEAVENQAAPTPENKREHPRLPVHWHAAIMLDQQLIYGKLSDVSRGGTTLLLDAKLVVGAKYPLYIRMPTPDRTSFHQLEASVQVCNIVLAAALGCYRIGMRFTAFQGNTEALLMQYIQTHDA